MFAIIWKSGLKPVHRPIPPQSMVSMNKVLENSCLSKISQIKMLKIPVVPNYLLLFSVWLKFSGEAGVVTPSQPSPPVLRCFWKDPLMTPTTPLQASFTTTPLPLPHPFPPKNFDHTLNTIYYYLQYNFISSLPLVCNGLGDQTRKPSERLKHDKTE